MLRDPAGPTRALYLSLIVLPFLLAVQVAFLAYRPVLGVMIQLVPACVMAWAIGRDAAEAAVGGFVAGLLIDLLSVGPFGGTALALMIAVWPVEALRRRLPESRLLLPFLLGAVGIFTFSLAGLLLTRLSGYAIPWEAARLLLPTAVLHTPLIFVATVGMQAAGRLFGRRRVEL